MSYTTSMAATVDCTRARLAPCPHVLHFGAVASAVLHRPPGRTHGHGDSRYDVSAARRTNVFFSFSVAGRTGEERIGCRDSDSGGRARAAHANLPAPVARGCGSFPTADATFPAASRLGDMAPRAAFRGGKGCGASSGAVRRPPVTYSIRSDRSSPRGQVGAREREVAVASFLSVRPCAAGQPGALCRCTLLCCVFI